MDRSLTRDKSEIAKEHRRVRRRLTELFSESDRDKMIPLSLSVLSRLADTNLLLQRRAQTSGFTPEIEAIDFILSFWWNITWGIVLGCWRHGASSGNPLLNPPCVQFIVMMGSYDAFESYLRERDALGELRTEDDMVSKHPFTFAGKPGHVALCVRGGMKAPLRELVDSYLELRQIGSSYWRIGGTLKYPGDVAMAVDEHGLPHLRIADSLHSDIMKDHLTDSFWPRGGHLAYRWVTDILDIAPITIDLANLGRGPVNRKLIREENETIRRGFIEQPGFGAGFFRETGLDFSEFFNVLGALAMVAYDTPSGVAVLQHQHIIDKVSNLTGLDSAVVESILRKFDDEAADTVGRPLIPLSGGYYATSFEWAGFYRMLTIEKFFYGPFDPGIRGRILEDRCSQILQKEGFFVFTRHQVTFDRMTRETIEKRLGFAKARSDIDILAHAGGILLLAECKEVAPGRRARQFKRGGKDITEASKQIDAIAFSVSKSSNSFERLIPIEMRERIGIDASKSLFIFPLVITNLEIADPKIDGAPLVYFGDLRGFSHLPSQFASELAGRSSVSDGSIKIQWTRHRTLHCYVCRWS